MQRPELVELMDKARFIAGSDYRLAVLAGVSRHQISNWRNGLKPCPPEEVGTIAKIAGLDGVEWTLRALVWKYEGTPKGERLLYVFSKRKYPGFCLPGRDEKSRTLAPYPRTKSVQATAPQRPLKRAGVVGKGGTGRGRDQRQGSLL